MKATPTNASSETPTRSDLSDCDTNNATRIGWPEWQCNDYWPADYLIENKRAYYRHLDRHNAGLQNGPKDQNKSYETYWINRNLVECIGGRLNMSSWEKKRATALSVGLLRSNMGLKSEVVAFCTCAYVIEEYDDQRKCHPQMNKDDRDAYLEEQRQEREISEEQFSSVYGKVAYQLRTGNLDLPRHDKYEMDRFGPELGYSSVNRYDR